MKCLLSTRVRRSSCQQQRGDCYCLACWGNWWGFYCNKYCQQQSNWSQKYESVRSEVTTEKTGVIDLWQQTNLSWSFDCRAQEKTAGQNNICWWWCHSYDRHIFWYKKKGNIRKKNLLSAIIESWGVVFVQLNLTLIQPSQLSVNLQW